jgi:hypothetical protein
MSITIIKDLRSKFGEIRDQGPRPTCIAFAAGDCHSFMRNNNEVLSVEYAFYHAVQRTVAKDRTRGVTFSNISDAILIEGQPLEEGWNYIKHLSPSDEWQPPGDTGALFRRTSKREPSDLVGIYTNLDADIPSILVMDISLSFYTLKADSILSAPSTESKRGVHGIIAVGYGETEESKCILVRNSWGNGWSDGGYGWVNEAYLKPRLHLVATMD